MTASIVLAKDTTQMNIDLLIPIIRFVVDRSLRGHAPPKKEYPNASHATASWTTSLSACV